MLFRSHSASFYYRLQVPLETASVLGMPVKAIIDTNDAGVSQEERIRTFCEADVVHLYQPIGEHPINNIRSLQSFLPSKVDGEWKWAPTIVVETDDNLFNVSPLNQAFKNLGIRDMDGNMIPIGHHIGVVQGGEKKILWADGKEGFSLSRNRQAMASYKTILELADVVQCSTPEVEKAVLANATPRRTNVFPNMVRLDHYPQVDIVKDPKRIRILWQGGSAHYEDWYPLKEAIGNISKKYPEVDWIMWGANYPWVNELIPAERITYMDWCPYQEYKLRLCMIGHDISLAPLTDNVFNRCRSAIKWYEASVLKTPAATLAQNTGAYKAEIEDGKTALLFNNPKEFEEKLSLLIEDTKLRKELGANAKQWISENRDAMKLVPKMFMSWAQLREERKLEQPHMSDEDWAAYEASQLEADGSEIGVIDEPVPALNESS
mgnify:FL=1